MKRVKLISEWECRAARSKVHQWIAQHPDIPVSRMLDSFTQYGNLDIKPGTGRSICRQCGRKIEKGEMAIHGEYDFSSLGSGSYTLTSVQIHLEECPLRTDAEQFEQGLWEFQQHVEKARKRVESFRTRFHPGGWTPEASRELKRLEEAVVYAEQLLHQFLQEHKQKE